MRVAGYRRDGLHRRAHGPALLTAGHEVELLVSPKPHSAELMEKLSELGDIKALPEMSEIRTRLRISLAGKDAVVHAAGVVGTDDSQEKLMWGDQRPRRRRPFWSRQLTAARPDRVGEQLRRVVPPRPVIGPIRRLRRARRRMRGPGLCGPGGTPASGRWGAGGGDPSVQRGRPGIRDPRGCHRTGLGVDHQEPDGAPTCREPG